MSYETLVMTYPIKKKSSNEGLILQNRPDKSTDVLNFYPPKSCFRILISSWNLKQYLESKFCKTQTIKKFVNCSIFINILHFLMELYQSTNRGILLIYNPDFVCFGSLKEKLQIWSIKYPIEHLKELQHCPVSFLIQAAISVWEVRKEGHKTGILFRKLLRSLEQSI